MIRGSKAYISWENYGLVVADISNPYDPHITRVVPATTGSVLWGRGIALEGSLLLMSEHGDCPEASCPPALLRIFKP